MISNTRLIGSGNYSDGSINVIPNNQWVVWDGDSSTPVAKRLRIVDSVLYEPDETTKATLVPSYVPSGATTPTPVIYPDDSSYAVEVIRNGRTVLTGHWKVPYDPEDNGVNWWDLFDDEGSVTYPTARYEEDALKIFTSSGAMFGALNQVLEGTLVYTTAEEMYWGRTSDTFVPFQGVIKDQLIRDWDPKTNQGGQVLHEYINSIHGILGDLHQVKELDLPGVDDEYMVQIASGTYVTFSGSNVPSNWDPDKFVLAKFKEVGFAHDDGNRRVFFQAYGDTDNYIELTKEVDNSIRGRYRYNGKNYDASLNLTFASGTTIFLGMLFPELGDRMTIFADTDGDGTLDTQETSERVGIFYPDVNSGLTSLVHEDQGYRFMASGNYTYIVSGSSSTDLVALVGRDGLFTLIEEE